MAFSQASYDMTAYLSKIAVKNNHVVVFDIDGTLLTENNEPIQPVINLYNYSKYMGYSPIIITARAGTPENIEKTRQTLHLHGITGYLNMYFRPPEKMNPYRYKWSARKHIYENGFITVASIGDMPWDIGEYGGRGFLI